MIKALQLSLKQKTPLIGKAYCHIHGLLKELYEDKTPEGVSRLKISKNY